MALEVAAAAKPSRPRGLESRSCIFVDKQEFNRAAAFARLLIAEIRSDAARADRLSHNWGRERSWGGVEEFEGLGSFDAGSCSGGW